MRLLACLLLVAFFSAAVEAGGSVYRWVDAQGQVHYSQLPPEKGSYERIERTSPAPAAAPDTNEVKGFLERAEAANKAEAEEKAKRQQTEAESRAACGQARERLAYLDEHTARRLAVESPDGTMARMDEAEFERRRAAAQKLIQEHCR